MTYVPNVRIGTVVPPMFPHLYVCRYHSDGLLTFQSYVPYTHRYAALHSDVLLHATAAIPLGSLARDAVATLCRVKRMLDHQETARCFVTYVRYCHSCVDHTVGCIAC